jgi:hypothetical protein
MAAARAETQRDAHRPPVVGRGERRDRAGARSTSEARFVD